MAHDTNHRLFNDFRPSCWLVGWLGQSLAPLQTCGSGIVLRAIKRHHLTRPHSTRKHANRFLGMVLYYHDFRNLVPRLHFAVYGLILNSCRLLPHQSHAELFGFCQKLRFFCKLCFKNSRAVFAVFLKKPNSATEHRR
uniref:Secreted protein n=1 Tax=Mesocestoides corti TaxID=53468 RepID=A0A5K3FXT8_MESCO